MDLVLNNLQRLICHKTQTTKPNMDVPVLANPEEHLHQLCVHTRCNLEDLLEAMNDKDE